MKREWHAITAEATKELNFTNERRTAKRVTGSRTFIRSDAAAAASISKTIEAHGDTVRHGTGFVLCFAEK